MSDKTVLVTGAAGFIGSSFVEKIMKENPTYKIIVVDALTYAGNINSLSESIRNSPNFEFWHEDIRNEGLINELVSRSDMVVHFAAESHVARSIFSNRVFFETDVLGTQSLGNAIVKNIDKIEKFIHISTSEVYGTAETVPMDENHPLNPTTPYASAKAGADRLVYSYWKTYDIPATIVRPFNNYGPRQHLEKVIPRFITRLLRGETINIHGSGTASRDWLYVEDHCEALNLMLHASLEKVKGQTFNLGTKHDVNINEIANTVIELIGGDKSLVNWAQERPGQVDRHIGDNTKAKNILGWQPSTSFDEGIKKTVEWYRSNESWWSRLEWMSNIPVRRPDGTIEFH